MTTEQIKQSILGEWVSITPEVRPSSSKNPDGSIKPFYLRREFKYITDDKFELVVTNYADAFGKMPLAKMSIKGHIQWRGEHPIAPGAQNVGVLLTF